MENNDQITKISQTKVFPNGQSWGPRKIIYWYFDADNERFVWRYSENSPLDKARKSAGNRFVSEDQARVSWGYPLEDDSDIYVKQDPLCAALEALSLYSAAGTLDSLLTRCTTLPSEELPSRFALTLEIMKEKIKMVLHSDTLPTHLPSDFNTLWESQEPTQYR